MPLIDKEQKQKHAAEERKLRFQEYVKEQSDKKAKNMPKACLHSEGYRDFYGPVVFAYGMHKNMWILPAAKNPKVLIFEKEKDAADYAKALQEILRKNGFPCSKAWAEEVAVSTRKDVSYSKSIITYEDKDRYIIRMSVRK